MRRESAVTATEALAKGVTRTRSRVPRSHSTCADPTTAVKPNRDRIDTFDAMRPELRPDATQRLLTSEELLMESKKVRAAARKASHRVSCARALLFGAACMQATQSAHARTRPRAQEIAVFTNLRVWDTLGMKRTDLKAIAISLLQARACPSPLPPARAMGPATAR
jgi:hypothetical protein